MCTQLSEPCCWMGSAVFEPTRAADTDPIAAFSASDATRKALWLRPALRESFLDVGGASLRGFRFDSQAEATCLWNGFGEVSSSRPPRLGLPPHQWQALVGEVATRLRRGELGLRKVVLARAHQVRVRTTIEGALRNLASAYPTCTIFAFATGDACFLGATPERLVSLRHGTATTMALAGSAPRGATPEEDRAVGERLLN